MQQSTFRGDITVVGGHVYMDFDASDMTSGPFARCGSVARSEAFQYRNIAAAFTSG